MKPFLLGLFASLALLTPPRSLAACAGASMDIGGRHLWVDVEGQGKLTVVFESGGGNDSTVWADITPRIRAAGARTFVYDRAGLGRSDLGPDPYSADDEVKALRNALTHCDIAGPIIIAAHSYGGLLSLLTAAQDKRVIGVVLIDALVPKATPKSEVDAILAEYRPQYAELRAQAPELAKAMIPFMEAYPMSIAHLDAAKIPLHLRIIDIVAEHTVSNTVHTAEIWYKAHNEFVANNKSREKILAIGSSHKVIKDQPELVVTAIVRMISLLSQ